MVFIQVPDELVEKLQHRGVADIQGFVERLIQQADDDTILATTQSPARPGALVGEVVNERVSALIDGFAQMREGLSRVELAELTAVINEEYIESDELTSPDDNRL